MLLILDNKELAASMRKEGYDYALKHFSPEILSTQMMNLYQNL